LLVAAVLDARNRVTPRRAALVLLVAWIATVAVDSGLGIGAGWLALAVAALAGSARPVGRAQARRVARGA